MAEQNNCAFCGKKLSILAVDALGCGGTMQLACKDCYKMLRKVSELDRCRLALEVGRAREPEQVREAYDRLARLDEVRLTCPHCGVKMTYGEVTELDTSPFGDGWFGGFMQVRPLRCEVCGLVEFFHPKILQQRMDGLAGIGREKEPEDES